jgi:Putative peptidoglycan binding domain
VVRCEKLSTDHVVKQGEHLSQIAELYGFRDYRTVWNDPANAQLRANRANPNVLMPGDVVHVPDRLRKQESVSTDHTHRFTLSGRRLMLRLALRDFGNEPLANAKCVITIAGVAKELNTNAKGHVEMPIAADVTEATVAFDDPSLPFDLSVPIRVGYLDPVAERSGQRARLSNLGYITRPLDKVDESYFAAVVQEFQCDFGLKVTGVCDSPTQIKLKDVHGS